MDPADSVHIFTDGGNEILMEMDWDSSRADLRSWAPGSTVGNNSTGMSLGLGVDRSGPAVNIGMERSWTESNIKFSDYSGPDTDQSVKHAIEVDGEQELTTQVFYTVSVAKKKGQLQNIPVNIRFRVVYHPLNGHYGDVNIHEEELPLWISASKSSDDRIR